MTAFYFDYIGEHFIITSIYKWYISVNSTSANVYFRRTNNDVLYKPFFNELFIANLQLVFINLYSSLIHGLKSIPLSVNSQITIVLTVNK